MRRKRKARAHLWTRRKRVPKLKELVQENDETPEAEPQVEDNVLQDRLRQRMQVTRQIPPPEWSRYLKRIYFDVKQPGSFQSFKKLHQSVRKEGRYQLGTQRLRRWLQNQQTYSKNKVFEPGRIKRARVIVSGLNDQFDADLADFQKWSGENGGVRYLLVVIDIFSRYTWAEPIHDKTNESVKAAFRNIFEEGRIPRRLRTDAGKEFTANTMSPFFEEYNITHFISLNEPKANYAERVIKTLKSKIVRYMNMMGTGRYTDILEDMLTSYNNTYHTKLKMAPSEVSSENADALWWSQYKPRNKFDPLKRKEKPQYKYAVGDHVRIPKTAVTFGREYDQRWTGEIFEVTNRFQRDGINMYKVEDQDKELVLGSFYEGELQRVLKDQENKWKVERIISEEGEGADKRAYVKFAGWPAFYNRWIPAGQAHKDLDTRARHNVENGSTISTV